MTGTKRGQWVVFETRRTFQVTEYTSFLPRGTVELKDGAPVGQLCLVGLTQSSHKLA